MFLPRIEKLADTADKIHPCQKSELRMLEIVDFKDVQNLQPRGPYKLKEPTKDAKDVLESGGLGLIVLPGVAMTLNVPDWATGWASMMHTFISTRSCWECLSW